MRWSALVALLSLFVPVSAQIAVGSKNFTESAVLGEMLAQMLEEHTDLTVERRLNLGGTMICQTALTAGEIDLYVEYTGTAWAAVLREAEKVTGPLRTYFHVRRAYGERFGIRWLQPLGLNNSYAIAMSEAKAASLGIERISDLLPYQAELRAGFSIEFGNRPDGYLGLAETYGLTFNPATIEHALAYAAIKSGSLDLIDAYSTDGKLLRYRLRVLEDDRGFFPPYHAAPLVRGETLASYPEIENVLERLAFRITDQHAQALNYVVEETGASVENVVRAYLEEEGLVEGERSAAAAARISLREVLVTRPVPGAGSGSQPSFLARLHDQSGALRRRLLEHLGLTAVSVFLAVLFAVPLGILTTRSARLRQVALGAAGIVQTVPSLALLALMIPLLGLDVTAAIAALFLYAILPILRNTHAGISQVDPDLIDAAQGLGMRPRELLMRVQVPLAIPTIMAGIRTATVISIGVATLAAFIGAGGLGAPIVEGLYLNDPNLILIGAIPAALLAVATDLLLGRVEMALQPRLGSSPTF